MPTPDGIPYLSELAAQLDAVHRGLDRQQDRATGDLAPHHLAAIPRADAHVTAAVRLLRDSLRGVTPTRDWPAPFKSPTRIP
jgi:hypothetical protein